MLKLAHTAVNNLTFFAPRFNEYKHAFQQRIANANNGMIFERTRNCGGAVDGSFIPTARPKEGENAQHNGYYGASGFILQSAAWPCGLFSINVPIPAGLGTDWFAWQHLPMRDQLIAINNARVQNGEEPFALFGDAIYNDQWPHLFSHWRKRRGIALHEFQVHENSVLKIPRSCVEHAFGKLKERTTCLRDFTNKMMPDRTYPVKVIILAVAFTNLHTILAGAQTPLAFDVMPTDIDTYLAQPRPHDWDMMAGYIDEDDIPEVVQINGENVADFLELQQHQVVQGDAAPPPL